MIETSVPIMLEILLCLGIWVMTVVNHWHHWDEKIYT